MKKARYVIVAISILLIGIFVFFGISILNSPEYALMQIADDIEENGIEGIMPHLTDDAKKTVSTIISITENELINSIFSLTQNDDFTNILKSNLKDIEWSLEEVLKNKEKADVVLGVNYNDKISGTIEIKMVRENGDWKISGLDLPTFNKN